MKNEKSVNFYALLVSLVLIAFGILMIVFPKASANVLSYIVGSVCLFGAVGSLAFYLATIKNLNGFYLASFGVLTVVGVLLIVNTLFLPYILTILVTALLVGSGLIEINNAIVCSRNGVKSWIADLISGIVVFGLGVTAFIIFIVQGDYTELLFYIFGASLILDGLTFLCFAFILHRDIKLINKN